MNPIDKTFQRLKEKRRSALIPFIMAGVPDLETTEALLYTMAESGADMIEIGVPFSDPIADGPVLQAASQRALKNGIHLKEIFGLSQRLKEIDVPILLMTYFNPVLQHGLKPFAERCKESAIDGVIIPDLPPEEASDWIREARSADLDTVFLTSPTSPPERIRCVSEASRRFVYHVSVTGVTGSRRELPEGLEDDVRRIKEQSRKPVAVGFGISTSEQAKKVSRFADGVIVGSALVRIMDESPHPSDMLARVGDFISTLGKAMNPDS